ncbi:MAG: GNAT family N-acetyltransferase [Candidatus Thermoplasmatota archaeon]|nr:GNAT family N-acetyltransferase [Candidatus Thermoplasmatota archaeon]
MEIVHYDEVKDSDMTELTLACFQHAYSKRHLEEMIELDTRLPGWGGELYAVENGRVLAMVGLLYPKAETKEGPVTVGGIRNVCCRPSESKKGVTTELLKEAHDILREKVRYSFLMTSDSLVASSLYKKFGYKDIHVPAKAYKKIGKLDSDVRFEEEEDPEYIRSVYHNSVSSLTGLVKREEEYWDLAEVRGWPDNEEVKIAYKDGERIGYAMFNSSRNHLTVKEVGAEDGHLSDILNGLESFSEKEMIVLTHVNPAYKEDIIEEGYNWTEDMWSRIKVKNLEDDPSNPLERFGAAETFHAGIYEYY